MAAAIPAAIPEIVTSKTTSSETSESEDLIHCDICHNLLEDPRTLSCLHTFCLKCLVAKEELDQQALSCPTCSVESKLPDSGVSGLDTIAFIVRQTNEAKMREELADKDRKVECTACEEGSSATMRCFECDDFLCKTCVKAHKRNRHQKQHQLLTLDELLTNKELQTIPDQNICSKHKGETLMFFCETCDVPICSKCAVVAHRHPEHKQAELDGASTDERKKRIKELENEADKVSSKIHESISLFRELERNLKTSASTAMSELDDVKETLKSEFLENLEKRYKESKDAIHTCENQKADAIKINIAELESCQSRLATSKKIADDMIIKGSEFEIASVYSSVTRSLKELCRIATTKPPPASSGEIYVHFADKKSIHDSTVGKLCRVSSHKVKQYDMKKCKQFGQLKNGRGIAFAKGEEVVVSNHDNGECFSHVYSDGGDQLFKIDNAEGKDPGWTSYPWCIVYTSENGGQYFGTDDTQYVKLFSGNPAIYKNRFNVLSPNGVQSGGEGSKVQGLALDKDGNLIVGNVTKKYVSIMKKDGTHIKSMDVSIQPWFISATTTENIIVSSYEDRAVQVIDRTGKVLLTLNPPDGMPSGSWYPTGVCCSKEGAIFVANYKEQVGIFQYSLSDGKYIGCCTKDVTQPWGIALSKDETKFAVADDTCVKIFEINKSI